jgi:plastocyanin
MLTLPALLAAGMLSTPTVSAGNPCFHGYEMPPSSTGPGTDIKLMPCAFVPTVTVIAPGESVNFVNGPEYTHLVTGAAQEWGSPEIEVQPDQTVTYTFDAAGVYPYACALHPGMSGAIVVGDLEDAVAAGAAGSTTTGGSTGTTSGAAGEAWTGDTTVAGSGSDESDAAANTAAYSGTETSSVGTLVPVGLGIGAGLVAGAAAVWLALRRRSEAHGMLASAK